MQLRISAIIEADIEAALASRLFLAIDTSIRGRFGDLLHIDVGHPLSITVYCKLPKLRPRSLCGLSFAAFQANDCSAVQGTTPFAIDRNNRYFAFAKIKGSPQEGRFGAIPLSCIIPLLKFRMQSVLFVDFLTPNRLKHDHNLLKVEI